MKDIGLIKFIKQNSRMLSITGSIIFLSAGWNLISQSYAFNCIGHSPERFVVEGEFVGVSDNK